MTQEEKIAVLQERGDEHCRRHEAANCAGLSKAAAREKRAYLAAYTKRDLVASGYDLTVHVRTRDEHLAAATARYRQQASHGC